jgi:hypothetical protein
MGELLAVAIKIPAEAVVPALRIFRHRSAR